MCAQANLASVPDNDFVELVRENGQILMRGPSNRTHKCPSCIRYSSHCSKAQAKNEGDTYTAKRARVRAVDSISGDSPLLGLPGHRELIKHDKMNSRLNYTLNNSPQYVHHQESLHDLYLTDFDVYLEHNNSYDKHLTDSHIVPELEYANLKPRYPSNSVEGIPQLTATRNSQLQQSSLQLCQASAPFMGSRVNSTQTLVSAGGLPNSKLQDQDSGPDKKLGIVNFSHFLRPAALLKANNSQGRGATTTTTSRPGLSRVEELKSNYKRPDAAGSSNPVELSLVVPAGCSQSVTGLHNQPNSVTTKVKLIKPIAKPPRYSLPDEHSEAVGHKDAFRYNRYPGQVHNQTFGFAAKADKGKPDAEKSVQPPVASSSSVCSREASNDPTYTLKRRCNDTEESAYPSKNVEEPKGMTKAVPARGSTGAKRSRSAEVYNPSEKRRRKKINKKMRALRELIPNCTKVDKASMLDEAIEYLKTLQLQVQMMSMGTSLCMPPMILHTGMQQIHAPHLAHFSPMGVGMVTRMGMGVGCSPAHFPASPISGATALPGITGTRFQMPGIPGQALTMLWSRAPFIPMQGGPST